MQIIALFLMYFSKLFYLANTYENFALNKQAWQQHRYYAPHHLVGADRAVDGKFDDLSSYGEECTRSDNSRPTAEWRVDLGEVLSIHHVFIQYMTDNAVWDENSTFASEFLGFSLYISNTTTKEDGVLCFKDTHYSLATIPNPVNILCHLNGRYVIYYNNRTDPPFPAGYSPFAYNELCEVEVYGCPNSSYFGENCSIPCGSHCFEGKCDVVEGTCMGCVPGYRGPICDTENVALNKPAWQQYPYPGQPWGADKAVDGRYTDLSAVGGQCVVNADNKLTAEWRVDLGGVLSIHHISIQYRTDNVVWDKNNGFTSRFLGFSLYISNTTNKEDGFLCFKDTNYSIATIPNPVNILCHLNGRYVIYYNNRTAPSFPVGYSPYAHNELCEVEVYGCSNSSYFGDNCSMSCNQNCLEGLCDIMTETCLGCSPGYTGPTCDTGCNTIWRGKNSEKNKTIYSRKNNTWIKLFDLLHK